MSSELEHRLQRLLARPSANEEAADRALVAALAALPAVHAHRRPMRTALLASAAALILLAVSAGALAAAGALHVSLSGVAGSSPAARPAPPPRLVLPAGARGIEAVVDGRLWLTSRGGLRIEGLPVHSATLSPHALYVAAGVGDSLVVMAPDGTRAWSHRAGGRVVAIAWAPNGLRIAYVVQRAGGGMQLRTIEGDGDHDVRLDGAVRDAAPSWRADSLAVAYVGAGGRPVVYDFARRAHRVVAGPAGAATALAFAPLGNDLAIASARRVWVGGASRSVRLGSSSVGGITWVGGAIAVALDLRNGGSFIRTFGPAQRSSVTAVDGQVTGLDAVGGRLVVAVERRRASTRLLAAAGTEPPRQVLLDVPPGSRVEQLAVR